MQFHPHTPQSKQMHDDFRAWFTLLRIWPWNVSATALIKITGTLDVIIISAVACQWSWMDCGTKEGRLERKALALVAKRLPDFIETQRQLFHAECISASFWEVPCCNLVWFLIGSMALMWPSDDSRVLPLIMYSLPSASSTALLFTV